MSTIQPIHLVGVGVAIALFYQSIRLVQKRKENVLEFLLWTGMGAVILLLSLSSVVTILGILEATQLVLEAMGFRSGRDGIFVMAILSLLMMLFYTYVNAKTNRKLLYDLNQEIAITRYKYDQLQEELTKEAEDS